jgi:tRNA pseudouridine38-40 synthase
VQKTLENALSTILNENISTTGAGRTDTGVHALLFSAHFESSSSELAHDNDLIFKLNRFLPKDIAASSIARVIPDAHARFSAISRTYKYYISKNKDPFIEDSAWYVHGSIDLEKMNEACQILLSESDFTSFAKLHSDSKTNICKIINASWNEDHGMVVFTIKADRFLRNMVRAIAGTMVELGMGKITIDDFREIIRAKDRCKAGKSAPAKGLFLTGVDYPDEIFVK